jgi:3-dehydroquinate dehydratase/shikimate dehydrogenase
LPPAASRLLELLRVRSTGLCTAIAGSSEEELGEQLRATTANGSGCIELRFDALPDPAQAAPRLRTFCVEHPEVLILATCRRVEGGGALNASVQEQLALLARFALAGAQLIDVEMETLAAADPWQLSELRAALDRADADVLVSAHDFVATGDLDSTLHRLQTLSVPLRPALYKVVSTATCLADNLRMLHFLETASRAVPVVGMCMGAAGVPSRVLALRAGAQFTFAAADGAPGTAPGQLSLGQMRDQYRVPSLTAKTRIYGISGNPVSHSLSPVLHNACFAATGMDAVYLPLHTESVEDLWELVQGMAVEGLSVTMPWKVAILPYLDTVESEAARFGAINTVLRRPDGSYYGANTDLAAIVEPLAARISLPKTRILLLGAGGAARAAAFGLQAAGAEVFLLNRTPSAAEALARETNASLADPTNLRGYDVILNATPSGMLGPAANTLAVEPAALDDARVVFDMVSRPTETPLVRLARARGLSVITGDAMFLHQAAAQWQLWTGTQAPLATMRAALETALRGDTVVQKERTRDGEV